MIESFEVIPGFSAETTVCDLADKVNEIILKVNDIEAKLQSATPTNKVNHCFVLSVGMLMCMFGTREDAFVLSVNIDGKNSATIHICKRWTKCPF